MPTIGEFDVDLADLGVYRDKSTGTNTDRSGYQEMMTDAENDDLDAVVVHSISRICRSIGDLERTAGGWRIAASSCTSSARASG